MFLTDLDQKKTTQLNDEEAKLQDDRDDIFAAKRKQMVRLWKITAVLGAISLGTHLSLSIVAKKLKDPLVVNIPRSGEK